MRAPTVTASEPLFMHRKRWKGQRHGFWPISRRTALGTDLMVAERQPVIIVAGHCGASGQRYRQGSNPERPVDARVHERHDNNDCGARHWRRICI
jgi:hypothetical protein